MYEAIAVFFVAMVLISLSAAFKLIAEDIKDDFIIRRSRNVHHKKR